MTTISMDLVKKLRDKTQVGMMDCKKALEQAGGDFEKAVEFLRKKGAAVAAKRAENETLQGRVEAHIAPDFRAGSLTMVACETDFSANTDAMKTFAQTVSLVSTENEQTDIQKLLDMSPINQTLTLGESLNELISKICESIKIDKVAQFKVEKHGVINAYIHPGSTIGVLIEIEADNDVSAKLEDLQMLSKDICMQVAVTNPICIDPSQLPSDVIAKERTLASEQLKESGKPEAMIEKIVDGKMQRFYSENCLIHQAFIKNDKISIKQYMDEVGKKIASPLRITRFARFAVGRSA